MVLFTKTFSYPLSHLILKNISVDAVIIPILQMKTLRHKSVS